MIYLVGVVVVGCGVLSNEFLTRLTQFIYVARDGYQYFYSYFKIEGVLLLHCTFD